MKKWMIYGASGYTAQLISKQAKALGMNPILGGRDAEKIRPIAEHLGLEYRIFDLLDPKLLDNHISDLYCVLHCAGPYRFTELPMLESCLRKRVHYLDITGEVTVLKNVFEHHQAAVREGITLLPAVGFDIVPTDCLSLQLKTLMPDASELELVLPKFNFSHGTLKTLSYIIAEGSYYRREGTLLRDKPGARLFKEFDFLGKNVRALRVSWGDVMTAYITTGIPNITAYFEAEKKRLGFIQPEVLSQWVMTFDFVTHLARKRIDKFKQGGPAPELAQTQRMDVWGIVTNPRGQKIYGHLSTGEPYHLTSQTALASVRHVLEKPPEPGFSTPATAFGKDFILEFEGISLMFYDAQGNEISTLKSV